MAASVRVVTAEEAVVLIVDWAIVAAIRRIMMTVKGKGMMAVIMVEGMTWGDLCGK